MHISARNETKRNETKRNGTKRRCATLPFYIVRSVVKRNGIVLNDIGNVFLTRTVYSACSDYYGSFEADELIEETMEASHWVCPDGERESFGLLPFDKEEILPLTMKSQMRKIVRKPLETRGPLWKGGIRGLLLWSGLDLSA